MKRLFLSLSCLILTAGCQQESKKEFGDYISIDFELIKIGREIFEEKCLNCHSFNTESIGPMLGSITRTVESQWIKEFIKSAINLVKREVLLATSLPESAG